MRAEGGGEVSISIFWQSLVMKRRRELKYLLENAKLLEYSFLFQDGEFDPVFLSWREGAQERKRLMVQEKNGMPDGTRSDWIKPTVAFFVWHVKAEYLIDSGYTFNFYLKWIYFLYLLFHFPQNENSQLPLRIYIEYITFPILMFTVLFSEFLSTSCLFCNVEQKKLS